MPTKYRSKPRATFQATLLAMEVVLLILWASMGDYGPSLKTDAGEAGNTLMNQYSCWIGVHAMMILGFGGLMQFLHRYGYSATGDTFFVTCLGLQWGMLCYSFFHALVKGERPLPVVDLPMLFQGDFAVAAVLISFGAVLGKASPLQMLWLCAIEVVFYALNEAIVSEVLMATDTGGSMVIHTFGAYFGLAVTSVLSPRQMTAGRLDLENHATATSDLFAMIGTLFLFLYWPSFNGGLSEGSSQARAFINTVLSLSASCLSTFTLSKSLRGAFSMVDVQNATLAGGVAVGATASMLLTPGGALLIGLLSGGLSTYGFARIQPMLADKFDLQDTCGINNLHGMPGIFGALVSVIVAFTATSSATHGIDISTLYPGREDGRSATAQAGIQLAALLVTLAISVLSGWGTGLLLKHRIPGPDPRKLFVDDVDWLDAVTGHADDVLDKSINALHVSLHKSLHDSLHGGVEGKMADPDEGLTEEKNEV